MLLAIRNFPTAVTFSKTLLYTLHTISTMPKTPLHSQCISGAYPGASLLRQTVDKDKISWNSSWPEYSPPVYTSETLKGKPYADPDIKDPEFRPAWNALDGDLDRRSYTGEYAIVDGCPRNPVGRTGLQGRGRLGRWGVNHAGDPVVTRWKTDKNGNVTYHSGENKPILQFVAIQRQTGQDDEWAFPGGMVDPGETPEETVEREFYEEALEGKGASDKHIEHNRSLMDQYFRQGIEVYRGYVDDPRNTDNSWMETVAINHHDQSGSQLGQLKLKAGSDAKAVEWKDVSGSLKLYANHSDILRRVAERLKAHW